MSFHDTLVYINSTVESISAQFNRIPGSAIVLRYVRSSYQNDPMRSFLELCLFLFAVRYFLASKYSFAKKDFIKLSTKEVDELVDEWTPEPLVTPLDEAQQADIDKIPVVVGASGPKVKLSTGKSAMNLASFNMLNLLGNEQIRDQAIKTVREYGVGACGPSGFYGTGEVHIKTEKDISNFLRVPASLIYAQAFNTISSTIPAFAKRGDIIVADSAIGVAIQKGILISRSTVRWFKHNDMDDLERVLQKVQTDFKGQPLTRRFIVTEGLFENIGDIVDLPRIIELKYKYKYRVILDESCSIGVLGKTGRGLTEYFNVPATEVDMIVGSLATTMCAGGGFCAGSDYVVAHQRISGNGYVFSAAVPGYLAATASEAMAIMQSNPDMFTQLLANTRVFRAIIDKTNYMWSPSDPDSPLIHLQLKSEVLETRRIDDEDKVLQDVVDECIANGVLITRSKVVPSQEIFPVESTLKIMITTGLTKRETEKAAAVVKAAISKVMSKVPKIKH
ncbi:pyridoxal phosphate-dependent transferase [Lipomyces orientalis]|uniref:Pyridoxal phosphate-dependent transferase n=1 Tax=Lipomyces orientalis TaxID=1233043 RepID=A0ACC3TRI9_9ASCO